MFIITFFYNSYSASGSRFIVGNHLHVDRPSCNDNCSIAYNVLNNDANNWHPFIISSSIIILRICLKIHLLGRHYSSRLFVTFFFFFLTSNHRKYVILVFTYIKLLILFKPMNRSLITVYIFVLCNPGWCMGGYRLHQMAISFRCFSINYCTSN